jgi:hypothetical protein
LIFAQLLPLFLDFCLFCRFELFAVRKLFVDDFALAGFDFWAYVDDGDFAVTLAVQKGFEAALWFFLGWDAFILPSFNNKKFYYAKKSTVKPCR